MEFSLETPDKYGNVPDLGMVGKCYRHSGNQKVYEVVGFMWCGDTDMWLIAHIEVSETGQQVGQVACARTIGNFKGLRPGLISWQNRFNLEELVR
jgi:hypothetical protein